MNSVNKPAGRFGLLGKFGGKLLVAMALQMHGLPLWGQEPAAEAAPAEAAAPADKPDDQQPRGPHDVAEVEAFLDGVMAVHLKNRHIAGATLVVVADNKILFSKGYGHADLAEDVAVDPATTIFRIGSVSKLFTWTAVMQLVEQGKVDLDVDINVYLQGFKVPPTFDRAITLRHLLTHTAGFEDRVVGIFAHDSDQVSPLAELMARELPLRVRLPGEFSSYSNHGTALAGLIVAEVSGMSWEDYVEKNILQPLGMDHTLARQPPAGELPHEMSKGYKFTRGEFLEQPFEYVPAGPAGAIGSSAEDMARFMIAHLQDGEYGSGRILKEATARQMRDLVFSHDKHLDGMAYGFMRMQHNGEEIVHHGGDTLWFHSSFVMLPQRGTGFFVSYNTDTGQVRQELFDAFFDRYYPGHSTPPEPLAGFSERASRFTGSYASARHSYTSFSKLAMLLNAIEVGVDGNELLFDGPGEGTKRFWEVEPQVFRQIDGPEMLVFRTPETGHATHLFVNSVPPATLFPLPWYETPNFTLILLGVCTTLCLSAVVGWPAVAIIRRGTGVRDSNRTRGSSWASWLAWLTCLAVLAWLSAGLLVDPGDVIFGVPEVYRILLRAAIVLGVSTVAVVALGVVAWQQRYWRLAGRFHYTCVALALAAFLWFVYHWNLVAWDV